MAAEVPGEAEWHLWKSLREHGLSGSEIIHHMAAGRKEIRQHHDCRCTTVHTQHTARFDARIAQFEVRRLDVKKIIGPPGDFRRHEFQIGIRFSATRAMSNQEQSGRHVIYQKKTNVTMTNSGIRNAIA